MKLNALLEISYGCMWVLFPYEPCLFRNFAFIKLISINPKTFWFYKLHIINVNVIFGKLKPNIILEDLFMVKFIFYTDIRIKSFGRKKNDISMIIMVMMSLIWIIGFLIFEFNLKL